MNKPETNKPGMNKPYKGKPDMKKSARSAGNRKYARPAPGKPGQGIPSRGKTAKPKPTAPVTEGMPARRTALKVIRKVTEEGAYASLALDAAMRGCGLIATDRRLVSRLVYDTLDNLIFLDYILNQVMAREDTDIKLRNILRLGACQILLEDRIPESAATNTSVALCTELGMEGLKGVCNGILRNLIRKKDELVFPDPETEPDRAATIKYSFPEWLWAEIREEYGADAESIAGYKHREEGWTLRPNLTRLGDREFETLLKRKVWQNEKLPIPHAWRVKGAMDIGADADFLGGNFSIQTPGSMLASLAMDAKRGQTILDCCAAPGGKSCYLAEIMGGTGRVQAWDLHEHRTALIAAQAKRLGLENIRPMTRDAAKPREDLNMTLDGVLLDAPCTGTGMISEKPDIKMRVTPERLEELKTIQARLLETVSEYVKPAGILVYSTCSILKQENAKQVKHFLAAHPDFDVIPLPESIPEDFRRHYSENQEEPGLQLLPHRDGTEGFYLCRMIRKA